MTETHQESLEDREKRQQDHVHWPPVDGRDASLINLCVVESTNAAEAAKILSPASQLLAAGDNKDQRKRQAPGVK